MQTIHSGSQHDLEQVISTIHFLPTMGFLLSIILKSTPSWNHGMMSISLHRNSAWCSTGSSPMYLPRPLGLKCVWTGHQGINILPSKWTFPKICRWSPLAPLLTPFVKKDGIPGHLWTTFSADQIDMNFRNIDVLADMIHVMLA